MDKEVVLSLSGIETSTNKRGPEDPTRIELVNVITSSF
jgi:hypothetical protein